MCCWAVSGLFRRPVRAQPIGTFRWQLQPYCNIVTLNVTQHGAVFTLDRSITAVRRARWSGFWLIQNYGITGSARCSITTGTSIDVAHLIVTSHPPIVTPQVAQFESCAGTRAFEVPAWRTSRSAWMACQ